MWGGELIGGRFRVKRSTSTRTRWRISEDTIANAGRLSRCSTRTATGTSRRRAGGGTDGTGIPSEDDITKIAEVGETAAEFPEFLKMMASRMNTKNNDEEIRRPSRCSTSTGRVSSRRPLTKAMKSLKEDFKPEEIDQLIKITGSDGKVSYKQFQNMMTMR